MRHNAMRSDAVRPDDDDDYDDARADLPGPGARAARGVSSLIGAVLALGLAVGAGVWLYRLGVRDAQNVPVIRASLEPSKELPDDPGGVETPHQDVASYTLADAATPPQGTAVLAPPPPRPTAEDLAPTALTPAPRLQIAATVTPVVPQPAPEADAVAAADQVPDIDADPTLQTGAVEPALAPETPAPEAETAPPPGAPDTAGATALAPPVSPAVRPRPADLAQRRAAAEVEAQADQGALAAAAAQSSIKVQLGAFPSREFTESEWNRIARANSDLLGGRVLIVETTISGGATWYRLRVGPFRDRAEAASICAALKARDQDCIVATHG